MYFRLNVKRTEWGRSTAFTMRSFLFTSNGTSGDNSDQAQRISCNLKLIPARSVPFLAGTMFPNLGAECSSPADYYYVNWNYAQMPDCDFYTDEQCEANRSDFSARAHCESNTFGHYEFPEEVKCDGGRNMCHILKCDIQEQGENDSGVCENCLNLNSAQDCQATRD